MRHLILRQPSNGLGVNVKKEKKTSTRPLNDIKTLTLTPPPPMHRCTLMAFEKMNYFLYNNFETLCSVPKSFLRKQFGAKHQV
jgi:hypothetical protein